MGSYSTGLELKAVNFERRVISGYAAVHHNIDRVGDIIDPAASAKAVRRLKAPSDVSVFVGHQHNTLPVGVPIRIEATPRGLYTETLIKPGPVGDDLLHTAKFLADHGLPLGMSIGYKTEDSRHEFAGRKRVRRLMDYSLKEYSFASPHTTANPEATVLDVKAGKGLREGSDSAGGALVPPRRKGGAMQYRVEGRGGRWAVLCDADADGDADDDRVVGTYDSQDVANQVAAALRRAMGDGDDDEDADGDKTAGGADETKAVWSTAYVNDLPDSSFLYVEPGGEKDSDGKTTPRSKRHFPYKDAQGTVDLPHLRNALARIPQSDAPGLNKDATAARARRLLASAGGEGKTADEPVWQTGSPLALLAASYRLADLAEQVAAELKAQEFLGEETKQYQRIKPARRAAIRAVVHDLTLLADHADRIDAGEDIAAQMALLRSRLELTRI